MNYDLFPVGGDGVIDARDLLELLKGMENNPAEVFDFAAHWKE